MKAPLDAADAVLATWRERLAAASRNVSELSELPEFALARGAAAGSGRLADEARHVMATVDELWQGVLLIGAALDRAEEARRGGSRLWRGEEAAEQALAILQGPSITVDLAETPVLHRRLLAGPRASATVAPDALLQTMEEAFDRARTALRRIVAATGRASALRERLEAVVAGLPAGEGWAARLAGAMKADPLEQMEALEALAPEIGAAAAVAGRARAALLAAEAALGALREGWTRAEAAVEGCRGEVLGALPPLNRGGVAELEAWLGRIGRTFEGGRIEACMTGLGNWRAQFVRVEGEVRGVREVASAAVARREELRARFGAYRAKHRARAQTAALVALEAAAGRALAAPTDLFAASTALAAYEAALAGRGGEG